MKKIAFLFGVVSSVNAFGMTNVGSSNENTTQSMFNLSSNPSSNRSVYETEELCKQIAGLEEKLKSISKENDDLVEQVSIKDGKILNLQKQLDESYQYINSVEQEKNDLERNKENLEKDKKKLERENNELKKKLNKSDESIKKTNNHIQQLEKKIDNLKNNSATQKIASMNSENNKQDEPSYDQLMQWFRSLHSENQRLLATNKSLYTNIEELLNKNEILNTEKEELLNKNKILSDNNKKLLEENKCFRTENDILREREYLSSDDENFPGSTLQSELRDSVFENDSNEFLYNNSDNNKKLLEENKCFRTENDILREREYLSSDDENFPGSTLLSELGDSVFENDSNEFLYNNLKFSVNSISNQPESNQSEEDNTASTPNEISPNDSKEDDTASTPNEISPNDSKKDDTASTPNEISPFDWGPFRRQEPIKDGEGTLLLKGNGKVKIEASRFIGNTIVLSKAGDEIKFDWTTGKYSPVTVIWKLTGGNADKPFSLSQNDFADKQNWLISGSVLRVYSNNDDSIVASPDFVFKGTAKGVPQGFRLMKGTMIDKNTRKVIEL